MPEITGTVIFASVAEDASGIHIRVQTEDDRLLTCFSSIEESWLKIPEGRNPQEELKKVCDLLNGFRELEDGSIEPIPNFNQKKVTIIGEN